MTGGVIDEKADELPDSDLTNKREHTRKGRRSRGKKLPIHTASDEMSQICFVKRHTTINSIMNKDDVPALSYNAHIYKAGEHCSFGKHRDSSGITNSESRRSTILGNGNRLPTSDEMVVTTTCFCQAGFMGQTHLRHFRGDEMISDIATGVNHVHFQGFYANSGIMKHQSTLIGSNPQYALCPTVKDSAMDIVGMNNQNQEDDEDYQEQ